MLISFYQLSFLSVLLPLDGRGWLGGDVVADAVDAAHAVDNLIGNTGQEVVRQVGPVGSHGVGGGDGTQGYGILVGTLVAHHTDRADGREEDGSGLPYLIIL